MIILSCYSGGLKMNIKRLSIIFLVFLTLVLSISAISAADEEVAVLETPSSNIDTDVVSADTVVVPQSQNIVNSDVKQTTEINTKPKIKTKVEADQVAVVYKKNNKFRIEVEDRYDDDIKYDNVKLNVKIGTKTFTAKTNSYGVAKINTKTLKLGTYKVTITSADDNYDISKTSKIFVGKKYSATLKPTSKKAVLKNKDVVSLKIVNDFDEKDAKIVHKKAKSTKILNAKFYFKDKYTGQKLVKKDNADFDDGRWEMPDVDYSNRYSLVKVKVYYISTK